MEYKGIDGQIRDMGIREIGRIKEWVGKYRPIKRKSRRETGISFSVIFLKVNISCNSIHSDSECAVAITISVIDRDLFFAVDEIGLYT